MGRDILLYVGLGLIIAVSALCYFSFDSLVSARSLISESSKYYDRFLACFEDGDYEGMILQLSATTIVIHMSLTYLIRASAMLVVAAALLAFSIIVIIIALWRGSYG